MKTTLDQLLSQNFSPRIATRFRASLVWKILFAFGGLALFASAGLAQNVNVSGSSGADGSYVTLNAAFAAINANAQSGNTIAVTIVASTSEGATTAALNNQGWTSLTVNPSGAVSIVGATTAGSPLIDLNGANNVTIDGLNTGGNSLSIVNTTVSATTGTSTVRFINDASNNAVNNCTIAGSETSVTSGTIFFSTGISTGNVSNTISGNTITQQGGSTPTNAIFSAGTSGAIFNSGTISGNNIQDYFSATLVSTGINLSATGNSGWTISNNKLFQTATRVFTGAQTHSGIFIGTGSGYTITGNAIGFADASGNGTTNLVGNSVALTGTFPTSYTTTGTANATRYVAINCAFTAGGAASSIQNNTIGGFALYTSSGANTANGVWCGINVTSGNANIGTVTGNTIGATTGGGGASAASIYSASTATGGTAVGIYATSTNTVNIQNNTIGSVDAVGTSATLSGGFTGIDSAGTLGVFTINNNVIGNTSADNIRTGYTLTAGNLSNSGTLTSTTGATGAQVGIRNTASGATLNINSNTLRGWAVGGTVTTVTGITNTGVITGSVTNNSNLLGTAARGWVRYAFANSGALAGIARATAPAAAATLAINSNDFRGIVDSVASTHANTYISWTHGPSGADTINGNMFTNLSLNTTGAVVFINHGTGSSMTATGSVSVSNNQVVTGFANASASATTFCTSGSGDTSVTGSSTTYNLNNFSNVTLTGASAVILLSDSNGASSSSGPTKTIANNTFNNITIPGAAQLTGISFNFSGNNTTVSNNTLTNFSSGGVILAIAAGTSNGGATETISGNTLGNYTSGGQINALQTGFGLVTTGNITGNTITNLSSSSVTANPIFALICSGFGTTTNISKNKIGNVQSTGNALSGSLVFGILAQTAATTYNISNNLVGDLRLPANPAANNLVGISIGTLTAGATVNVSDNTVWLNESTNAVAGFGSSAISASTTPAVVLRGNILVNNSVHNTTGLTVAYRRSDATLGTYGAASNNNDFYAGTPGANNLIFFDGTNSDQTMAAFKSRVASRDSASFTENPTFLSTTATPIHQGRKAPADANFLHIDPTVPTQLESGGAPIAGITDDFDGDTRNATTPDVGADEFNGISVDLSPPIIVVTPLGDTTATGSRMLTATISDAGSGVPTAGVGLPVLYWKVNAGSYTAATASFLGGNQYQFTFGAGAVTNDTVSYYIVAQDGAATPNVTSNPSAGASGYTANPPAASTPPTTPFNYKIKDTIMGTFTVGAAGAYSTLTAAVTDLNNKVMSGPVVFTLLDANNTTVPQNTGEVFPIVINANSGASAINTVTIKPAASVTSAITGSASGALIKLNGASHVIIDGSNSGGTDRSLTIENTSVTTPGVLQVGSVGTTPITDVTVKNCIIRNGINTSSAVVVSDAGTLGNAGYFSAITIQNNSVQKAFVGVYANGGTTPQNGANLTYSDNDLSTAGTNSVRNVGLYMQGVNGATVTNNIVGNLDKASDENDVGIWLATGTINATVSSNLVSGLGYTGTNAFAPIGINVTPGATSSSINVEANGVSDISSAGSTAVRGISISGTSADLTIQRNNVQGVVNTNTGTYGAYGIDVSAGNNIVVKNNFVSNVSGDMSGGLAFSTQFGIFGIRVGSGTGHQIYNNSVNLYGLRTGTSTSSLLTAAFAIVSTSSTNMDVRDNIFANNITGGTTSIANVAVFLPSGGTGSMLLTENYNAYYYGTDAARAGVAQAGTTAGTNFFVALSSLQAYSQTLGNVTNDTASLAFTGAVPFATANDLHITCASPVADMGTPIGSVVLDFDGQSRSLTAPDMGADEITAPVPVSVVSRKTHGGAGTFDLPLPLVGPVGIECRSGGGTNDHEIVFTFASPVTVGSASVDGGTFSIVSATGSGTSTITVDITGVSNAQYITVGLNCVDNGLGASGNMAVTMGVLLGDTTADGSVNSADIGQTKSQSGNPVTGSNYRQDVTVDGSLNSADIGLVKSKSGTALP